MNLRKKNFKNLTVKNYYEFTKKNFKNLTVKNYYEFTKKKILKT